MSAKMIALHQEFDAAAEYTHSDDVVATARSIDNATKTHLHGQSKDDLLAMAQSMTADGKLPIAKQYDNLNKNELVEWLFIAAAQVLQVRSEERAKVGKDELSQKRLWIAKQEDRLDEAQKQYKAAVAKEADGARFDGFTAGGVIQAAANCWAAQYCLRYRDAMLRDEEPMSLDDVKAEITKEVLRNVRGLSKSTGQAHNVVEETRYEALAHNLERY